MEDARLTVALAAVLGVLAVATAAAALTGVGTGGGSSGGLGVGDGDGVGSGNASGFGVNLSSGGESTPEAGVLVQRAATVIMLAAFVVPIVYAAVVVWQEGVAALLSVVKSALRDLTVMAVVVAAFGLLLWFLLEVFSEGGGGVAGAAGALSDMATGEAATDPTATVSLAAPVVAVGVLVLLVGVVLSLTSSVSEAVGNSVARVTGSQEEEVETAIGPTIHVSFADVDASNDVYRAWRTMARSVDGRPGNTVTPAEVRRCAIDSGFDEGAVDELTHLFRAVRYSGEAPTADREERARAALERLDNGHRPADS